MESQVLPQHEPKEVTIIVNTRPSQWPKGEISFDDVVKIAYPTPPGQDTVYTVSFTRGSDKKPNGTLVQGQSVEVVNDTVFSVTPTNKS